MVGDLNITKDRLMVDSRKIEILVLGDSHAGVFTHESIVAAFPEYSFKVISVGGATISGLENPNSKTQAMPIFMGALSDSRAGIVIVLIGEVDTGFVIWYQAEKYSTHVDVMCDAAVRKYQKFLHLIGREKTIICISTPLPTIKDGSDWGDVANARKEVKASQLDRTKLTVMFNEKMNEFCNEVGIKYIMLDSDCLGADGLVHPDFVNDDPTDHHYDQGRYAQLILSCLTPIMERVGVSGGGKRAFDDER
ncbi:MAG TPA: hypothetical protein VL598_02380 [Trinickia sp.]|jgi:hypothetical protein|uniref:hypothetical protein n=1 Tax=Trinickia sp. TaxID=2571163 RepID=UPI002C5292C1|nr:hypothetical protein [Trinickia sp.]HTI16493.1 hypothetical protein [Trinickia sp.]